MDPKAASNGTVDALFSAGRFADILRVSLPFLERGALSTHDRLLAARAMLHAGDVARAKHIAEEANEPHTNPLLRSRCELVLGIVAKRTGDLAAARRRMQHSVRLAKEAGDIKQQAWSQLSLFRLLAEGEPEELLGAMLSETRALVTAAADPHVAAYLHDSVALLEAQTGRLDESRRHLEIAASIIERYPNAWIEQVVDMSRLCLALLECDLAKAVRHARKARRLCELAGGYGDEFTLDINEAYIHLFTGKFERAHAALQRVVRHGRGFARLAALNDLARLHLALNRLDECETTLHLISAESADPSVPNCFQLAGQRRREQSC